MSRYLSGDFKDIRKEISMDFENIFYDLVDLQLGEILENELYLNSLMKK